MTREGAQPADDYITFRLVELAAGLAAMVPEAVWDLAEWASVVMESLALSSL